MSVFLNVIRPSVVWIFLLRSYITINRKSKRFVSRFNRKNNLQIVATLPLKSAKVYCVKRKNMVYYAYQYGKADKNIDTRRKK